MRGAHRAGARRRRSTGRLKPVVRGLALLAVLAAPLTGQSPPSPTQDRRPRLPRTADSLDWIAYYERGFAEVKNREFALAESYFAYASRLDPTVAEPLVARYGAWWKARPWLRNPMWVTEREASRGAAVDSAEAWLRQALLRDPFVDRAPLMLTIPARRVLTDEARGLGLLALFSGRAAESVEHFTRAIANNPADVNARRWRALAFARLERWPDVVRDYEEVIRQVAEFKETVTLSVEFGSAELHHALGLARLRMGDTTGALHAFEATFVEDLSFYMGHLYYAMLLRTRGDTAQAHREYALAVELQPDDPVLRQNYGVALFTAGRTDSALVHFQAAVRLNPAYATPYFNIGLAYERLGKPDEAKAAYRAFLARAPRRLTSLIQRAEERLAAP